MPKKLDNIKEKIINQLSLMLKEEQDDISIRSLARETGIAVGTIYNYFSDKEELFKALFQKEWTQTLDVALEEIQKSGSPENGADSLVRRIYSNFENVLRTHANRKQLLNLTNGKTPYPHRNEAWQWLCKAFKPVWQQLLPSSDEADRLTIAVVSSVHRSAQLFPDEKEQNIAFIRKIIINRILP